MKQLSGLYTTCLFSWNDLFLVTMKIKNIHDTLFRETMSQKELASDFLQNYLPETVTHHLRLDTLAICKDTFVDQKQDEHYSDLLYKVTLTNDQSGYVYFLFEHKSYHDRFVALQVLRYILEIWELFRKQNPKTNDLPLIIPVVVYHGLQKRTSLHISELVDLPDPELKTYLPDFEMAFYDFSPDSEQEIKGLITLRLVLSCFQAKNRPKALRNVRDIFKLLNTLDENETSLRWMEVIFRYLLQTMDISEENMQKIVHQTLSSGKEDTIMTLAEQLESKGMRKGMQKGIQKGRMEGRNAILNTLFRKRFGDLLDPYIQEKLRNASPEQLDIWAERILDAKTVEDVIKE